MEEMLQAFWELDRMEVADSELGDTDVDTITRFEQNIVGQYKCLECLEIYAITQLRF